MVSSSKKVTTKRAASASSRRSGGEGDAPSKRFRAGPTDPVVVEVLLPGRAGSARSRPQRVEVALSVVGSAAHERLRRRQRALSSAIEETLEGPPDDGPPDDGSADDQRDQVPAHRTANGMRTETLGGQRDEQLSDTEARAWVDARTEYRPLTADADLLGVMDVAHLLGLASRQAVHGRRERGRLIGFANGRRDVLFPRAQFDERGRVLPGIVQVLELLGGDGYVAWSWLTSASAALDGARPIDRLREVDGADDVLGAAQGHAQGDFG